MRPLVIVARSLLLVSCAYSTAWGQHGPGLDGITARLLLLSDISSHCPQGVPFRTRLTEPVRVQGQTIVPKGTVFDGRVQRTAARRFNHPGSVRLVFDAMRLPNGVVEPVTLTTLSVGSAAALTDAEGVIHGKNTRKKIALEIGSGAMLAKVADDLSEAASATVSKRTARVIGLAGVATFFLFQMGPEVKMPRGTLVDVVFGRTRDLHSLAENAEEGGPHR